MISWSTIQFLLVFFGPWLLPRILATYRSIRSRPASEIKPLPQGTSYALWLLFLSGLVAFVSTFPICADENVFRLTQSRLQTPPGVLMTRLATIRPLTQQDANLRAALESGGARASLVLARYGPSVLRDCPLTTAGDMDSSSMYLLYAMPAIVTPHILHLFALGIATSGRLTGPRGARWRTLACITGLVLGIAEFYYVSSYDDAPNQKSTRVNDIDFAHWKVQVWRGLAIAAVDGLLGWVMWLQATNRAFISPLTPSERMMNLSQLLESTLLKARSLGVMRNGTMRSLELRARANDYWSKDAEVMRDIFEEPEVLQAQRNALARHDLTRIGREADLFLDPLIGSIAVNRAATRQ